MNFTHENIKKDFDILTAAAGISLAEMSRRIGDTPQGLNQRIKTGKLQSDLDYIIRAATACGFSCRIEFEEISDNK